jgi:hypothetical protein
MLNLHANLKAALASPTQCLTWCWKLTRADNTVLRLTSYDRDLYIDGTYQALGGYRPSAVDTELGWNSQNQSLEAILDSPAITEADLDRGLYDFARLECFLVNVLDLPTTLTENPAKHIVLYRAILGKVTRSNLRYTFEARGFEYLLNNKVGSITSKLCRARFGDSRCGVNIANYTYNLSVVAAADRRTFTLSNANIVLPPVQTTITLTSTAKSWADAEAEAVGLGGHLVTVRSQAENDRLLSLFDNGGEELLWIGLYKNSITGQFEWSSGEPVTYTNWNTGEPNNLGNNEAKVHLYTTFAPGKWNDVTGSEAFYGIIELPGTGANYTNAPDGWFTYGTVTFTSGNNAGVIREVASYSNNTIVLFESTPFNIAPGTTLQIATGCDKTLRNCFRYNNVVNFQGEPYIPTPDKFASTPIDAG